MRVNNLWSLEDKIIIFVLLKFNAFESTLLKIVLHNLQHMQCLAFGMSWNT